MVYNRTRVMHSQCQHGMDILVVNNQLKEPLSQVRLKKIFTPSITDIRCKFQQN